MKLSRKAHLKKQENKKNVYVVKCLYFQNLSVGLIREGRFPDR